MINDFRKIITWRLTDRIEIHENRADLALMYMMMYIFYNMKFDFGESLLNKSREIQGISSK